MDSNTLPFKCRLCPQIYAHLKDVKAHYETHITNRGTNCNLDLEEDVRSARQGLGQGSPPDPGLRPPNALDGEDSLREDIVDASLLVDDEPQEARKRRHQSSEAKGQTPVETETATRSFSPNESQSQGKPSETLAPKVDIGSKIASGRDQGVYSLEAFAEISLKTTDEATPEPEVSSSTGDPQRRVKKNTSRKSSVAHENVVRSKHESKQVVLINGNTQKTGLGTGSVSTERKTVSKAAQNGPNVMKSPLLDEAVAKSQPSSVAGDLSRAPEATIVPKTSQLANTYPLRDPYFPQVGDQVVIIPQAYNNFLREVTKVVSDDIPPEVMPFSENKYIVASVTKVEYKARTPQVVLFIHVNETSEGDDIGVVKGHQLLWSERGKIYCPDFIILKQIFDRKDNWYVGDRFRAIVNQSWWTGQISNFDRKRAKDDPYLMFEVTWDGGEEKEWLSPWHFVRIDNSWTRKPKKVNGGLPLLVSELIPLLYDPVASDWAFRSRESECNRILTAIDYVMQLRVSRRFLVFEPERHQQLNKRIVYPMDLTTIRERVANRYYRRRDAVFDDLSFLVSNTRLVRADQDEGRKSRKVEKAEVIAVGLKKAITENKTAKEIFRKVLVKKAKRSLTDDDFNNSHPKRQKSSIDLLNGSVGENSSLSDGGFEPVRAEGEMIIMTEKLMGMMATLLEEVKGKHFAAPFIKPNWDDLPNYRTRIRNPMDFATITERLEAGFYENPMQMRDDMRLIVDNSKAYNTTRGSIIWKFTNMLSTLIEDMIRPVIEFHESILVFKEKKRNKKDVGRRVPININTIIT